MDEKYAFMENMWCIILKERSWNCVTHQSFSVWKGQGNIICWNIYQVENVSFSWNIVFTKYRNIYIFYEFICIFKVGSIRLSRLNRVCIQIPCAWDKSPLRNLELLIFLNDHSLERIKNKGEYFNLLKSRLRNTSKKFISSIPGCIISNVYLRRSINKEHS